VQKRKGHGCLNHPTAPSSLNSAGSACALKTRNKQHEYPAHWRGANLQTRASASFSKAGRRSCKSLLFYNYRRNARSLPKRSPAPQSAQLFAHRRHKCRRVVAGHCFTRAPAIYLPATEKDKRIAETRLVQNSRAAGICKRPWYPVTLEPPLGPTLFRPRVRFSKRRQPHRLRRLGPQGSRSPHRNLNWL